jgi:sulfhydrogenase subunit beta (sulfur reductase)
MEKIIVKQAVNEWIEQLMGMDYTVMAPQRESELENWRFDLVRQPESVDLNFLSSAPSPKNVVFPQSEVLLYFRENNGGDGENSGGIEVEEVLPEDKQMVVFGIRPCDGRSMLLLDKVFGGDLDDPYYRKRRNNTTLIGLGCITPPSPHCFCTSVGGAPHDKTGLDILITDLEDDFYVETLTPKGVKMLDVPGKVFRIPKAEERNKMKHIQGLSVDTIKRKINEISIVSGQLSKAFESPLWEKEAQSCIRCGECTYLCPTCHCFDMNDEVSTVSPLTGKRVRNWDTCQFPDFTMHSSGHNPRPDRSSRLRRRILHKFHYFVETEGEPLCTGCGRCISQCPVGIDLVRILNDVTSGAAAVQ